MKARKLLLPMVAVALSATPAMAGVSINPAVSDNVAEGTQVQLNAQVSQGKDGGCQFAWSQTGGTVALGQGNGGGGQKHWVLTTPDVNGYTTLTFQVTVTGCTEKPENNGTATATVNVVDSTPSPTNNTPEAAITVSPDVIYEGMTVWLDGSTSSDKDGDKLTYQWEASSSVALSSTTDALVSFTAPNNTASTAGSTLEFKLTVNDGKASNSVTKTVMVQWVNDKPTASLSCPTEEVAERTSFTLDASKSTDTDDGIASYDWLQIFAGPVVAGLPVSGPESSITLEAPSLGTSGKKMTLQVKVFDKTGDFDTKSCDVMVKDVTPPVFSNVPVNITAEATSATGAAVTYDLPTATDAVDGTREVICTPASGSIFALDATTPVTCDASDLSGNNASASFNVKVVDTTPPALTLPATIGPIEGNTLGGANISYAVSASDHVDGAVTVTCDKASGTLFPVGETTVTCSATDNHHNTNTGSFLVKVVDTTPPAITLVNWIANGSSFYFGYVTTPAPSCTAFDTVSGIVPCAVTGYNTKVGEFTLTASATDRAGNSSSETSGYKVLPWTLKGFYSPVDMSGITNTVKGGSTIPMKFEVFVGTTELTATSSIYSIQTKSVSCTSMSGTEDPVDALATGGTSLRYDMTAGQFIYNWQTPKLAGTCYIVTVTTLDGSYISTNFKLK